VKDIVVPEAERRQPFCQYFGTCGGCLVQDWAEEPYRAWKRELVVTALARRGIAAPVSPLIDAHGAGRRRAVFHSREGEAGYMARRSHDLVAIDACPILDPALTQAPDIARHLARSVGDGDASFTASDSGLDVALKATRQSTTKIFGQLADIAERFDLARIALNGETLIERRAPVLRIGTAVARLPVLAFLQATQAGEATLARLAVEAVGKAKSIADLFCGIGTFALRLAATARVYAADTNEPAIAALARAAREAKGLKPIEAARRDLFREPLTAKELRPFDAAVFDPPRAGAEAQAKQIAKSGVPVVVAVSCDAQSFARDAAILIGGGYELRAVTPVDQFKYSDHVEVVGVFAHSA
jgi:23S rRNA (uracil1939-C5)-methyltransferase